MEQSIYKFCLDPDPNIGIEIEDMGTVEEMALRYYPTIPIEQARLEVGKLIAGWCSERTWYEISKPCQTCGQHPGKPVIPDGELKADYYCDECRPT